MFKSPKSGVPPSSFLSKLPLVPPSDSSTPTRRGWWAHPRQKRHTARIHSECKSSIKSALSCQDLPYLTPISLDLSPSLLNPFHLHPTLFLHRICHLPLMHLVQSVEPDATASARIHQKGADAALRQAQAHRNSVHMALQLQGLVNYPS